MAEKVRRIAAVDAGDLPDQVRGYLEDKGLSTHHDNSILQMSDDGNPFSEWLKANGYVFEGQHGYEDDWDDIALWGT